MACKEKGNPGKEDFVAIGRRAFREENAAGAHFHNRKEAEKHALHVLEEYPNFNASEKAKFKKGFVDEWSKFHRAGKNPGRKKRGSLAPLYLGAGLVMVGGLALALTAKAEEKEEVSPGITPGSELPGVDTVPEPDPYDPGGEEPVIPDPGISPDENPLVPSPKVAKIRVTISGFQSVISGVPAGYNVTLYNDGELGSNVELWITIAGQRFDLGTRWAAPHSSQNVTATFPTDSIAAGTYALGVNAQWGGKVASASINSALVVAVPSGFSGSVSVLGTVSSPQLRYFDVEWSVRSDFDGEFFTEIEVFLAGKSTGLFGGDKLWAFLAGISETHKETIYISDRFPVGSRVGVRVRVSDREDKVLWRSEPKYISVVG